MNRVAPEGFGIVTHAKLKQKKRKKRSKTKNKTKKTRGREVKAVLSDRVR